MDARMNQKQPQKNLIYSVIFHIKVIKSVLGCLSDKENFGWIFFKAWYSSLKNLLNLKFFLLLKFGTKELPTRDHPFGAYAKFYEKLSFVTPLYAHTFSYQG